MFDRLPISRNALITLGVIVLIAITLMVLDRTGRVDAPRGIVSSVTSPIGSALRGFGETVAGQSDPKTPAQQQLRDITLERDELLVEVADLRERVKEVNQLRELLRFRDVNPTLELVTAEALGRDPTGREQVIIVNQGSDAGVQVGMPVLSPNFLVGQVVSVEPDRSRVRLVIDAGFQTGAFVQNTTGEGIVYGRWQFGGRVIMRHLPVDLEIPDDALIVTSGKTERVPAGLVIGRVEKIERDNVQNETQLDVLPLVDFETLSSVIIITGLGMSAP